MKPIAIHAVEIRVFYVGGRFRGRWPIYDTGHRRKNGMCRVQSWCGSKVEASRKVERLNAGNFTLEELQAEMKLIPSWFWLGTSRSVNMWRVGKMWKASVFNLVGEGESMPKAVAAALAHAFDCVKRTRS